MSNCDCVDCLLRRDIYDNYEQITEQECQKEFEYDSDKCKEYRISDDEYMTIKIKEIRNKIKKGEE